MNNININIKIKNQSLLNDIFESKGSDDFDIDFKYINKKSVQDESFEKIVSDFYEKLSSKQEHLPYEMQKTLIENSFDLYTRS